MFACVEDPREGLVELRAVLMRGFFVSLRLAQQLGCPHCPHTLWSHHSSGCSAESCTCEFPQPPAIAAAKAEYLRVQQAAEEALRKRPKPERTGPRVTVGYEGKFCAKCGARFTKGDVGWHYVEDESGKVIRFCGACWEELLREYGE